MATTTVNASGADDTVAIENALQAMSAGDKLKLPDATYHISRCIHVQDFDGEIKGDNDGTTIVMSSNPPGTGTGLADTAAAPLDNTTIQASLGNRTAAGLTNPVGSPYAMHFWQEPDGSGKTDLKMKDITFDLRGTGAAGFLNGHAYSNYAYDGAVLVGSARTWDKYNNAEALSVDCMAAEYKNCHVIAGEVGLVGNTAFGFYQETPEYSAAPGGANNQRVADNAASSPSANSGGTVSLSAPAANIVTLTDTAGAFSAADDGKVITIRAANAGNRGSFIMTRTGPTTLTFTNASGVLESGGNLAYDIESYGNYALAGAHIAINGDFEIKECSFTGLNSCAWVHSGNYGKESGTVYVYPADAKDKPKVDIKDTTLLRCGEGDATSGEPSAFLANLSGCSVHLSDISLTTCTSQNVHGNFIVGPGADFSSAPFGTWMLVSPKESSIKVDDWSHVTGPNVLGAGDNALIFSDDGLLSGLFFGAWVQPKAKFRFSDNLFDTTSPAGFSSFHMLLLYHDKTKITDNTFKGDAFVGIVCDVCSNMKIVDNDFTDFNGFPVSA